MFRPLPPPATPSLLGPEVGSDCWNSTRTSQAWAILLLALPTPEASLPCHISLGSLALNTCAVSSYLSPDQVWPLKAEVVSSSAAQGEGIIPLVIHGEAGWQNQPTSVWKNAVSYTNSAVNMNHSEMPLTISWQVLKASKYEPNNLDVRGPSNKNIHESETTWKTFWLDTVVEFSERHVLLSQHTVRTALLPGVRRWDGAHLKNWRSKNSHYYSERGVFKHPKETF